MKAGYTVVKSTIAMAITLTIALFVGCGESENSSTAGTTTEYSNPNSIYWAGSFADPEEIPYPEYLWAYYNTTDGCSYIYTYSGWTLLAGGGSSQANSGQIVVNGNDGMNGVNGLNGMDGVDGKDGINGIDGKDGIDGINGVDGKDGTDGKDGVDGKDGKDGVDGKDGYVFVGETEEFVDGITFDVKSYAQLEAGNPYLYTYFKFYFIDDNLVRTYACYHTVSNLMSLKVAYTNFTEEDCNETSYKKTFSNTGYVTSSTVTTNVGISNTKQIYIYYPSSDRAHYYVYYNDGSVVSAVEYDKNGNAISSNKNAVLAAVENDQTVQNYSGSDDMDTACFVKSVTLDRYHVLGTGDNRNILATLVINDLSAIDTSGGIFVQVVNSSQDTVVNFRPYFVQNDTIKAVIVAPKLSKYTATGKEYSVRLKVGENVYRNTYRKFNISSSYSGITLSVPARINIEKVNSDSFLISISGYNLDFIKKMNVRVLNNAKNQIGDSVNISLTPIQWLSDTCKNAQKVSAIIPTPRNEGAYTLELRVNDEEYNLSSSTFIVHKNPYFTSFTIPETSVIHVGDFVTAMLNGKNFVNATLDVAQLNLTFSDGYKVIDTLKYEATVVHDSLINLKIYVPQNTGKFDIAAHYESATIHATFSVGECLLQDEGFVSKIDDTYYICKSEKLVEASVLEYDTYGWMAGTDGNVKAGSVDTNNYYIYKEEKWQVASSIEKDLGGCTISRDGVVGKSGDDYYICKSKEWAEATVLEYDTYGMVCETDGSIVGGFVVPANKYVCDVNAFRTANEQEVVLNKGCVSYTEGQITRQTITSQLDSLYMCTDGAWTGLRAIIVGSLIDDRDGNEYKTVVVGKQTWMAENINYSDSATYAGMKGRSWCYDNNIDSCAKYGRLYTWAAAMDSAGTWSNSGKGCGYGKTCSITTPARGICPEGWHIPTNSEWSALYSNIGSSPYAMQAIGFTNWSSATDAYGFSALPVGRYNKGNFNNVGSYAYFWSASVYNSSYAYFWYLYANGANYSDIYKYNGHSVRCLKD